MRAGMALSPLRAGSNVNWRTASSAAASSSSPAEPTTFVAVRLACAAIVSSISTAAPSAGVGAGRVAWTDFATRGGVIVVAGAVVSAVWADARGAAIPFMSSASALAKKPHLTSSRTPRLRRGATGVHRLAFVPRVPGISASAGSLQPKSCQRASPRNCGRFCGGLRPSPPARDTCPRGHATTVRCRARAGFRRADLAARSVQRHLHMSTTTMGTLQRHDHDEPLEYGFRPMRNARWYKRLQAWLLSGANRRYEALVADEKRARVQPLDGTVREIGRGGGNNLAFLRRGVHWIGVEPNPFFHDRLRARGE